MSAWTIFFVFLTAQQLAHEHLSTTAAAGTTFQLTLPSNLGPVRLGPSWTDRSAVACSATCMSTYPACTSFLYNAITKLCTPGSDLSSSLLPTPAEGDLYMRTLTKQTTCDATNGFSLQSYGNELSCIGYFTTDYDFYSAESDCLQKGAHLANATSMDKLKIFQAIAGTLDFWIGCSLDAQTGNYVWTSDTPLSTLLISQIFGSGEASENHLGGNCCQYCPHSQAVLVYDCSVNAPYACEI